MTRRRVTKREIEWAQMIAEIWDDVVALTPMGVTPPTMHEDIVEILKRRRPSVERRHEGHAWWNEPRVLEHFGINVRTLAKWIEESPPSVEVPRVLIGEGRARKEYRWKADALDSWAFALERHRAGAQHGRAAKTRTRATGARAELGASGSLVRLVVDNGKGR